MTLALAITCAISIAIFLALLASQPDLEPRHRMPEAPLHARAALRLRMLSAAFIAAQILRYQLATPGALS
jgi:hypothetical protein